MTASSEDDTPVFFEMLAKWLGPSLAQRLRDQPTDEVMAFIHRVVGEGMPVLRRGTNGDDTKPVYRSRDEWEDLVADYMHVYGISAAEALAEPWPAFVLFASKISQVTARDQFRYLQTRSIPWIKDQSEQRRAYEDLIDRGNLPVLDKEAERERKRRMQPKWLKDLDREFDIIKRNPRA